MKALEIALNWKVMTGQPMADEIIEALTKQEKLLELYREKDIKTKLYNDWFYDTTGEIRLDAETIRIRLKEIKYEIKKLENEL